MSRRNTGHFSVANDLIFWGTAAPEHVVPQNDWAADFGPSVKIIYPDASTTAFFGDTDFTVATWAKPTDTAAFNTQFPFSQFNINGGERKFYFVNSHSSNHVGFAVFKQGIGTGEITTQGSLGRMLDHQWYRLVGIHNRGVEISLFVNGQLISSHPWPHGVETGTGPNPQQPWLGGISRGNINYDVNQFWRGAIGPTCYYSRAWTSQEVRWDYNKGRGRRYSELGKRGSAGRNLLRGLVAFWQLTEQDSGDGSYIVRQDSHTGQHHLTRIIGDNPHSVEGVLPKREPIADDDRVHELKDRSSQGNSITQAINALRPYWDAHSEVVSIEPGVVFTNINFKGLDGQKLSLYLVSILKQSVENEPWLHLSRGGGDNTGIKIFCANDTLKVKAWIGGSLRELSFPISFPAERLIEIHFNGGQLSLWENGTRKARVNTQGRFDHPINQLELGAHQGLRELLIYNTVTL